MSEDSLVTEQVLLGGDVVDTLFGVVDRARRVCVPASTFAGFLVVIVDVEARHVVCRCCCTVNRAWSCSFSLDGFFVVHLTGNNISVERVVNIGGVLDGTGHGNGIGSSFNDIADRTNFPDRGRRVIDVDVAIRAISHGGKPRAGHNGCFLVVVMIVNGRRRSGASRVIRVDAGKAAVNRRSSSSNSGFPVVSI